MDDVTAEHTAGRDRLSEIVASVPELERARPGTPGGDAWGTFLRAHASLLRVLDTELELGANVTLSDFDVLMQITLSEEGRLRMSELARRALISRSGMTRRIAQLEERQLVERLPDPGDRRSVVIALTDGGRAVLERALPIHVAGIRARFVDRLTDEELAALTAALAKVVVECDFG